MKKQMILWTCMLLLVLAGCKKDDVQYTDRYELKGKVEKGLLSEDRRLRFMN